MTTDEQYMRRCLQLASNGLGRTRPNPLVGCVIVKEGRIVSEGYHQQHGQNHAERNAILRAMERGEGQNLKGATLYVNLEPCSHQGLTPPCADLIVESGLGRVVCCNDDPNPKVAGGGFAKLEAAGVEVVRHVLEAEGRELNRRFFTFMEQHRPYVILKWAESADGFMAPEQEESKSYWISTPRQTMISHKWRTEEAAILVGSQTYLDDHPQLTARYWHGSNPTPVVLDRSHRLTDVPEHWLHLDCQTPQEVVDALYKHQLQSVIIEGGRKILDAFIRAGIYDEVRVFRNNNVFYHSGLKAPQIPPCSRIHIIQ